jgi:hypothetical protein
MREMRNVYKVLVGKLERKEPLGGPKRRWKDNIRAHLRGTGWKFGYWIQLFPDRDQWLAL